jgi:hypothetical protein
LSNSSEKIVKLQKEASGYVSNVNQMKNLRRSSQELFSAVALKQYVEQTVALSAARKKGRLS